MFLLELISPKKDKILQGIKIQEDFPIRIQEMHIILVSSTLDVPTSLLN